MVFAPLQGERVVLRQHHPDDNEAIAAWLAEAAAAAGFSEPAVKDPGARDPPIVREGDSGSSRSGELMIEQLGEADPIGLVAYNVREALLAIPFIALAKPYRGWGYGSEAVRLLEQWAVHESIAKRFWTEIPRVNGLALYFWLRLGYRPEGPEDDRGWRTQQERDRMRMVRYAENPHT